MLIEDSLIKLGKHIFAQFGPFASRENVDEASSLLFQQYGAQYHHRTRRSQAVITDNSYSFEPHLTVLFILGRFGHTSRRNCTFSSAILWSTGRWTPHSASLWRLGSVIFNLGATFQMGLRPDQIATLVKTTIKWSIQNGRLLSLRTCSSTLCFYKKSYCASCA